MKRILPLGRCGNNFHKCPSPSLALEARRVVVLVEQELLLPGMESLQRIQDGALVQLLRARAAPFALDLLPHCDLVADDPRSDVDEGASVLPVPLRVRLRVPVLQPLAAHAVRPADLQAPQMDSSSTLNEIQ